MGEFSVVYKAKAINLLDKNTNTTVAVKTVKDNVDSNYTKALICELKTMNELGNHLNVVKLLGVCNGCINKSNIICDIVNQKFEN